jgi:hypothetical protein
LTSIKTPPSHSYPKVFCCDATVSASEAFLVRCPRLSDQNEKSLAID